MTSGLRGLPWRFHAEWIATTYGISIRLLTTFCFWSVGDSPTVWMATAGAMTPDDPDALRNIGWPVLDGPPPDGRPTSNLLEIIGANATHNAIDLSPEDAARFRRGECVAVPPGHDAAVLAARDGHLALGGVDRRTGRPVGAR